MFWSWDHGPTWLHDAVAWTCCKIWGHQVYQDHCGLPEHDSCSWCNKVMPGMAPR